MQELARQPSPRRAARPVQDEGVRMGEEDIGRFIAALGERSQPGTAMRYDRTLRMLHEWLPEDKRIRRGTVDLWLEELAGEGYSPNTLNYFGAVCDRWLQYMGAEQYRRSGRYAPGKTSLPAVTREEYHRLLAAAKALRKERSYLLIKLFAVTGIPVRDLGLLTVDSVRAGEVICWTRAVRLPPCLCRELLSYAAFHGRTGMIFGTRAGTAPQEAGVAKCLREVSLAAGLTGGKGTPRSLQKLYQNTLAELRDEEAMDALLEREQALCGWDV